jgi:hypothetical protein
MLSPLGNNILGLWLRLFNFAAVPKVSVSCLWGNLIDWLPRKAPDPSEHSCESSAEPQCFICVGLLTNYWRGFRHNRHHSTWVESEYSIMGLLNSIKSTSGHTLAAVVGGVVAGGVGVLTLLWYIRVTSIRAKYKNAEGKLIPGSNNMPFVDYMIHGFTGRNTGAPYGDFELSFIIGFPALMVSEPSIIKELLKGNAVKDYDKGELTLSGVEVIAGRQNLFSLDGTQWQHMRLIIDPAFRPNLVRLITSSVVSVAQQTIRKWKSNPGGVDNLFDTVSNYTLDIICAAAFGLRTEDSVGNHPIMNSYKSLLQGLLLQMIGLGFVNKKSMEKARQDIQDMAQDGNL